jgi:hypothetical protein
LRSQGSDEDTSEVDDAERKVAGVLHELEQATDGEVKGLNLEEVVDSDSNGRPTVKKAVDIRVQRVPKKGWV